MLNILAVVAVVVVAGLLIIAATRPDTLRVQRSATIAAPAGRIFPHIAELRAWGAWSPWEKKDPAMTRTFEGPASGKGAIYAWSGNKNVGSGRMEITEAVPPGRIVIKLDFLTPFEAHHTAEFTLEPQNDATQVLWVMHGPQSFPSRLMGLFMNMDRMIGNDFEAGLASLKALSEKPAG